MNDATPDGVVGKHHIIASLGEQHHYERSEYHHFCDSKNITNRKREDLTDETVLFSFFCLYMGLGLAHTAFDWSNAMLALLSKNNFSAKDTTINYGTVLVLYCFLMFTAYNCYVALQLYSLPHPSAL